MLSVITFDFLKIGGKRINPLQQVGSLFGGHQMNDIHTQL